MSPQEILAEFRKKYESTYVFVQMPDSKEENLFWLGKVQDNGNGVGVMRLESEEFGKIQLNTATAHTIKFVFPQVGVFQHGKDAFLFQRVPRRQWQRGLCQGNCSIQNIGHKIDPKGVIAPEEHLSYSLVNDAFKAQTFTYRDAVRMLQTGQFRSVAMEDGFSLILSPMTSSDAMLMYWTSAVASIKEGVVVQVLEPSFEPQIRRIVQ